MQKIHYLASKKTMQRTEIESLHISQINRTVYLSELTSYGYTNLYQNLLVAIPDCTEIIAINFCTEIIPKWKVKIITRKHCRTSNKSNTFEPSKSAVWKPQTMGNPACPGTVSSPRLASWFPGTQHSEPTLCPIAHLACSSSTQHHHTQSFPQSLVEISLPGRPIRTAVPEILQRPQHLRGLLVEGGERLEIVHQNLPLLGRNAPARTGGQSITYREPRTQHNQESKNSQAKNRESHDQEPPNQ